MTREQAINYLFYTGFSEEQINTIEQAFKQEPTTKNDLGVDCIDRQATLDTIIKRLGIKNESYLLPAERTIYQQIKDMPSVTPQEPFINKPCVSSGVCEHDKQKALDKIRAEIEQHRYGLVSDGLDIALNIINKYKAETEET